MTNHVLSDRLDAKAGRQLAIIDFEASCLPEDGASFPIEIALAKIDGSTRSWLIRPAPEWAGWDWSEDAERLHGISRAMLAEQGQAPERVFRELIDAAEDCDVYADCDLDAYWFEVLAHACGRRPAFPIRFLGEYLFAHGVKREDVLVALGRAKELMPQEHVARDDASRLALAVRLLVPTP